MKMRLILAALLFGITSLHADKYQHKLKEIEADKQVIIAAITESLKDRGALEFVAGGGQEATQPPLKEPNPAEDSDKKVAIQRDQAQPQKNIGAQKIQSEDKESDIVEDDGKKEKSLLDKKQIQKKDETQEVQPTPNNTPQPSQVTPNPSPKPEETEVDISEKGLNETVVAPKEPQENQEQNKQDQAATNEKGSLKIDKQKIEAKLKEAIEMVN